jgi:hypothetical protein
MTALRFVEILYYISRKVTGATEAGHYEPNLFDPATYPRVSGIPNSGKGLELVYLPEEAVVNSDPGD